MSNYNKYLNKMYKGTQNEFYEMIGKKLKQNKKTFIITANPETIMFAEKDDEFQRMFDNQFTVVVPDGIGVVKAAKLSGIDITERITGVDIAVKLLEDCNELKKSLYLFGAKQEVIDAMKKVIKTKYSDIEFLGATNVYIKDKDKEMEQIAEKKPDVVMVALGIPAQEKLIYKHLDKFEKGILIGVGGSFDVISGTKKRAPKLFIKTNTEWLYRIICEPKRLKRFWNSNVKFIFKIWKEKKKF